MPRANRRAVTTVRVELDTPWGYRVTTISTSLGARNGLLVKSRLALERSRDLDVVIFDKTGTLTSGHPALTAIAAASDVDERDLLRLAAGVEADSEHPVARAIVEGARRRGFESARATGFEGLAGRGARATIGGRVVHVGGPALLAELGLRPPSELTVTTDWWAGDTRR